MTRGILALGAILFFLLAGCSQSQEGESMDGPSMMEPPSGPPLEGGSLQVTNISISMATAVGNQSGPLPFIVHPEPNDGGPTYVEENATAFVVEAKWSCSSPDCRFLLELENPDDEDAILIFGEGSIRAQVPPEVALIPGKWDAVMRADSANVQVTGEIRTSVFYGAPVPDDYSAF